MRGMFVWVVLWTLENMSLDAVWTYQRVGKFTPFENFDSIAFSLHVARGLRGVLQRSTERQLFLEYQDNRGMRIFRTWDTVPDALIEKLRQNGYSNVDIASDDITLAVMCLAFWDDDEFKLSVLEQRVRVRTLICLLQLALNTLLSHPEEENPEAHGAGEGSGEPQPEPEAHGAGEGSGEPQPEPEAHGAGEGSGEPQPEPEALNVPMNAEIVRDVRRYRLRDTPQREISRQRRVQHRYGLRNTSARRGR